jgi:hypothetical protein
VTLEGSAKLGECIRQVGLGRATDFESRPDGRSASQQDDLSSALKFEDTYSAPAGKVLDPKLPAQAEAVRIFDNIVERASREMMQNLV